MPPQSWNLLSQHQVWVSASSLSGDSLALAFLPGQEDVAVPGEGTPTWWGVCRVPSARLGVASEGFGHSLEWASKCLGK